MRNIKVAAIQPGSVPMPDACNWQHPGYCGNTERLVDAYLSRQMAITFDLLEQAGREGCDIVTSCEDSGGVGAYMADIAAPPMKSMFTDLVERTAPMLEERFSEIAARYAMYVVGCFFERIGGYNCNIAAFFDRTGRNIGHYQKTHLPPDETWQSVPGDTIDTFGYGWCDGIGEATLRTRANDGSLFIVTAKNAVFNGAGKSGIVDPWGHIVAQAGFEENVVVTKVIDLDRKKLQPDWLNPTRMSGTADVRLRMSWERHPELYSALCAPVSDPLETPDLVRQLEIRQEILEGGCRWS